MSRAFQRSSSQYLAASQNLIVSPPFSVACWFNVMNTTEQMSLMCLADVSSEVNFYQILASGSVEGDPVRAHSRDSTGSTLAATSSGYSDSIWNHAGGAWPSGSAQKAYLNGGSVGTASGEKSPSGIDSMAIGRTNDASPGNYVDGMIAEAAVWNIDLTAADFLTLSEGFSSLFVRPQHLVMYWPLIRESVPDNEDIDVVGKYEFTDFNGVSDEVHPRVYNHV